MHSALEYSCETFNFHLRMIVMIISENMKTISFRFRLQIQIVVAQLHVRVDVINCALTLNICHAFKG